MSRVLDHVRFCGGLVVACYWELRAWYYSLALRHVGLDHPDSWLLTQRLIVSRAKVSDFLNRVTFQQEKK